MANPTTKGTPVTPIQPTDQVDIHTLVVVGCGSIGSWIAVQATYLWKPDQVVLADPDIVESKNLLFSPYNNHHIGLPKVVALSKILSPVVNRVIAIPTSLTASRKRDIRLLRSYMTQRTVVFDARDFSDPLIRKATIGRENIWAIDVAYDGLNATIHTFPSEIPEIIPPEGIHFHYTNDEWRMPWMPLLLANAAVVFTNAFIVGWRLPTSHAVITQFNLYKYISSMFDPKYVESLKEEENDGSSTDF